MSVKLTGSYSIKYAYNGICGGFSTTVVDGTFVGSGTFRLEAILFLRQTPTRLN